MAPLPWLASDMMASVAVALPPSVCAFEHSKGGCPPVSNRRHGQSTVYRDEETPAGMASNGELLVLMLSNGMSFGELAAVIEELKNKSKGAGTHARRELYWQAYTKLAGMCVHVYRASACLVLKVPSAIPFNKQNSLSGRQGIGHGRGGALLPAVPRGEGRCRR